MFVCLYSATLKWIEYNSSIDERSYFLLKKIRLCLITEEDLLTCVNLRFVINTDLIEALNMINRYFANILNRYIEHTFEVKNSDRKYSKFYKKALSSIVLQRSIAIENFNVCQEEFGFKMNALKNEDYCLSTCKDTDSKYYYFCLKFCQQNLFLNPLYRTNQNNRQSRLSLPIELH